MTGQRTCTSRGFICIMVMTCSFLHTMSQLHCHLYEKRRIGREAKASMKAEMKSNESILLKLAAHLSLFDIGFVIDVMLGNHRRSARIESEANCTAGVFASAATVASMTTRATLTARFLKVMRNLTGRTMHAQSALSAGCRLRVLVIGHTSRPGKRAALWGETEALQGRGEVWALMEQRENSLVP